jgi:hypothetical protein
MTQEGGAARAVDKAFRPSRLGGQEESETTREQREFNIIIYEQRVAAGQPLFEDGRE